MVGGDGRNGGRGGSYDDAEPGDVHEKPAALLHKALHDLQEKLKVQFEMQRRLVEEKESLQATAAKYQEEADQLRSQLRDMTVTSSSLPSSFNPEDVPALLDCCSHTARYLLGPPSDGWRVPLCLSSRGAGPPRLLVPRDERGTVQSSLIVSPCLRCGACAVVLVATTRVVAY